MIEPQKYISQIEALEEIRKAVEEVEAMQLLAEDTIGSGNATEVANWCGGTANWSYDPNDLGDPIKVSITVPATRDTSEIKLNKNDWIFRIPDGLFKVVSDKWFRVHYALNDVAPVETCHHCLSAVRLTEMSDNPKGCPVCSSGYTGASRIQAFTILKAAGLVREMD